MSTKCALWAPVPNKFSWKCDLFADIQMECVWLGSSSENCGTSTSIPVFQTDVCIPTPPPPKKKGHTLELSSQLGKKQYFGSRKLSEMCKQTNEYQQTALEDSGKDYTKCTHNQNLKHFERLKEHLGLQDSCLETIFIKIRFWRYKQEGYCIPMNFLTRKKKACECSSSKQVTSLNANKTFTLFKYQFKRQMKKILAWDT